MPTILYAEDDNEHRMMMRIIMKNTEFTLVEAHNGQEALQKIQYQHPDLVLLDLFMPRVDGYGVMEALQANPETRNIPIIVLSAWPTGDTRKRTKSAGAIDFIAKPYDPFELVRVVKEQLANSTSPPLSLT
jgi:two-component system sensor histidine kinase/response regulator